MHMVYIGPLMCGVIFAAVWCTCLKMVCESKTAGRRVKFGTRGLVVTSIWCTFDFLVFKVIWGYLVHVSQNGL